VLVGLSEDVSGYAARGYTPHRAVINQLPFRERYGMPFSTIPKPRMSASSRACRAVIAARMQRPGSEWTVFRALQFANFNGGLLFDDDAQLREVLATVPGIDAAEVVAAIDSPAVLEAYARDKEQTRTAAGSPTELQGKARNSDGKVRYTAPSVVFEAPDGRRLEAGGFQPVEAYDVLIANLDPTLSRRQPPEDPAELLAFFEFGLSTQEVAALMTEGNDAVDHLRAEAALLGLVADGRVTREALGGDAIWRRAAGEAAVAAAAA
jgi:DSBA-like thioredoxin domain